MNFRFLPGSTVEVPEIAFKEQVRLPPVKTALVIVDMQNDFVKPDGALVVPAAIETVPRIQELVRSARAAGVRIAYTQDTQVPDDPEFEIWPTHCEIGTPGWEIIEELQPHPEDLVCQKNRYDGFYGSSLDHFLSHIWKIDNLIIVGTVSNICVLHTAASAGLRYFHIVVPADCISALTDFDQALTLRQVSWLYTGSVVRTVTHIHFQT
jgi:nicotinamidase-related amidase